MADLINTLVLDPLPTQPSLLHSLIRSVIYQQLATSVASAIFSRLQALLAADSTPNHVRNLSCQELYQIGVSKSKTQYLYNIASFLKEHENLSWNSMTDDEIVDHLTSIKGIGNWSAQICLINYFRRSDIFPVLDLGIQKAMTHLYQLDGANKMLRMKMLDIANYWSPYRSTASLYLWQWKRNNRSKK